VAVVGGLKQSIVDVLWAVRHPGGRLRRATWPATLGVAAVRGRPASLDYGFARGHPVDRYYIEDFLRRFGGTPDYVAGSIQGRVLEVGGRRYTDKFGTLSDTPAVGKVHQVDVLHVDASNPEATMVGSLTDPHTLPAGAFDCIMCIQTLHVIYDVHAVVRTVHAALRPGGTALFTVPGITSSCRPERDHWGDWWRFTEASARRLFQEAFPAENVQVEVYGNLTAAVALLAGIAAEELPQHRLRLRDPEYDVLIGVRAVKEAAPRS
jgi:SAM-dependent methyltransferase